MIDDRSSLIGTRFCFQGAKRRALSCRHDLENRADESVELADDDVCFQI